MGNRGQGGQKSGLQRGHVIHDSREGGVVTATSRNLQTACLKGNRKIIMRPDDPFFFCANGALGTGAWPAALAVHNFPLIFVGGSPRPPLLLFCLVCAPIWGPGEPLTALD
jgi:hypothetical protein